MCNFETCVHYACLMKISHNEKLSIYAGIKSMNIDSAKYI